MTNLSININKVATLRNARGENVPDVQLFAQTCEQLGADGITVHPRPDERHIRYSDVFKLRPLVRTEFNIEGYPSPEFMDLVLKVKPEQVTLVPDAPDALTSTGGWDVEANMDMLRDIINRLREAGIRSSIFVGTDPENIRAAARAGADRVELYTKPYADLYPTDPEQAVAPFVEASRAAHNAGLGVNAGHDLSLENLAYFHQHLPYLDEVSIGHALITDALYLGIEQTVARYRQALRSPK
ncbi:MAG: pyridoxine 5'-phosphate synthase [Bacteroides sp.]|nr:pyridoxine 5'-phosphate synthase [Bacteroides sp.]MBD5351067.1 pyridoxine 5'-phosphate synthase [Bacteroides sp.]MDE6050735.1 pyridoxine 5'-phosphate synthase [Paramuribaculum sp.]